jgi:hypothetical protein
VKEILRKALSWAVDVPPETTERAAAGGNSDAAADFVRLSSLQPGSSYEPPAPAAPATTVGALVEQSPVNVPTEFATMHQGGEVDFAAVYGAAAIPTNEAAAVERVAGLVERYGMMDRSTARRAVMEALSFANVRLEDVLTDGGLKIQALVNYVDSQEKLRQERESAAQQELTALEQRIDALKTQVRTEREGQDGLRRACEAQAQRLEQVIDFLTPDAASAPETTQGG